MLFHGLLQCVVLALAATRVQTLTLGGKPGLILRPYDGDTLQSQVTWDEHSLIVNGERILFFSGEVHPFRLPVPSLWLDVLQKIKALGYNGVSIYIDWALLEGKEGDFRAHGIFDLDPFFEAAKTAGIYILARPGPYINAEVSGGGFPGWLQRVPGHLRTTDESYLNATTNYVTRISQIIAKAQITNGGPVILFQPENEYTVGDLSVVPNFPDPVYFQYVEDQYRSNGIVVPFISNDASPKGYFAPGPPKQPAAVDIYGYDGYPLGFDCANPYTWPDNALPKNFGDLHQQQSPSTPNSIVEFQGGSFDPWGGLGFAQCLELLGPEFERVYYKNLFSFGLTAFNIYMTYGGTNWGNIGHPAGYSSYDYGAVIAEDRTVAREKYSQAKLIANFFQASPAYLTAVYQGNANANGSYTDSRDIAVTSLFGDTTKFFVVRHAAYNSLSDTDYKVTLPTSQGDLTIPQVGGQLTLHGRDSKVFVTDYDIGGTNVLYSTAEIFTWKKYSDKTVLVVYGGPEETNELAIQGIKGSNCLDGPEPTINNMNDDYIINYNTTGGSSVLRLDTASQPVFVYLLDRSTAYNFWVLDLPGPSSWSKWHGTSDSKSSLIVEAGYLLRTAEVTDGGLHLTGDMNDTRPIKIIGGAPMPLRSLTLNGQRVGFQQDSDGVVSATSPFKNATFSVPDLSTMEWKVIDTLPEIQEAYDDSLWTRADLTYSNNTVRNLTTPSSLYSSDYGYHYGNLLYRGHFTANGNESSVFLYTQGGSAFGQSVWLNGTFIGSFYGGDKYSNWNQTYALPATTAGKPYVLTTLLDTMGLDENYNVGDDQMKNPRGVLDYDLAGHDKSSVRWRLTGNLHGEDYVDKSRGPLNEGGLYAERQGYHLPGAPTSSWKSSTGGPAVGIPTAGVAFYTTTFDLEFPLGYDIPLAFSFSNSTGSASSVPSYRCQIYVNGYQFGKYVHNIGPQDVYPVPEGIWNYQGSNYVAVSLWSLEGDGAKVEGLELVAGPVVQSGYGKVTAAPQPAWESRAGAY